MEGILSVGVLLSETALWLSWKEAFLAVFFPREDMVRLPVEAFVVLLTRPIIGRLIVRRGIRYHGEC